MKVKTLRNIVSICIGLFFGLFLVFNFLYKQPLMNFLPYGTPSAVWVGVVLCVIALGYGLLRVFPYALATINRIKPWTAIIIILLVTLVPRLIWLSLVRVVPLSDFQLYDAIATTIAQHLPVGDDYITLFPHTIGYPTVLALGYMLFGAKVIVAQMLNVLLSCGIALLLYTLGTRLISPSVGFVASILWAIWPSQIFHTALVSTEMLFTFLLLLCIYGFVRIVTSSKHIVLLVGGMIALGIGCACANAVRPLAMVMLIAMILYLLIFVRDTHRSRGRAALAKLALMISLLVGYGLTSSVLSWTIAQVLHKEIASFPIGYNVYVGLNLQSHGTWNEQDAEMFNTIKHQPGIHPQHVHDELLALALKRLADTSLPQLVSLVFQKNNVMWSNDSDSILFIQAGLDPANTSHLDFAKFGKWLIMTASLYYYVIQFLCLMALVRLWRSRADSPLMLIILLLCGIIAIHLIVEVQGRYHAPALVFFAIIASYGLVHGDKFIARLKRTEHK